MMRPVKPGRGTLYALLATYVSIMVSAVATMHYATVTSRNSAHESEVKWCSLMIQLDAGYNAPSPQALTPRGRAIANSIHQLVIDFDCLKEVQK